MFLIKQIMTMIALMSVILIFSTQNSFQKFESKSLAKVCQRLGFKVSKANRWRNLESYEIAGEN